MSSAPQPPETKGARQTDAKNQILNSSDKAHLKALRKSARQLSQSQTEVLLLAVMRTSLLMRGPNGTGKRWIARHVAQTLSEIGERVELLTKFFGVSAQGQIWIDSASLPLGMRQLARSTVVVVDDVPSQPLAAAAFFAHLDMLARIARCHPNAFGPRSNPSSKLSLTHGLGNKPWGEGAPGTAWSSSALSPSLGTPRSDSIRDSLTELSLNEANSALAGSVLSTGSTAQRTKEKEGAKDDAEAETEDDDTFPLAGIPNADGRETLSFGGLQILGTQNADVEGLGEATIAWGNSIEPPSPLQPPSAPSFASSSPPVPPPPTKARFGVVVTHAAPSTSPSPHADLFVVVFRSS